MNMRPTSGNLVDGDYGMHEMEEVGVDEKEAQIISFGESSSTQSTSNADQSKVEGAEKRPVCKPKKVLKTKNPDLMQVSAEIMRMLGELREHLRKSCRKEEQVREDNITGFLRSLACDMRQVPEQKLFALKLDIMQVVQHYVHLTQESPSLPTAYTTPPYSVPPYLHQPTYSHPRAQTYLPDSTDIPQTFGSSTGYSKQNAK